jgi:DNA-binding MarR family transcriptional regulator
LRGGPQRVAGLFQRGLLQLFDFERFPFERMISSYRKARLEYSPACAGHLGVRQPTVTDSVIALERKGLVRRQADPADARATIVKVTPDAVARPAAAVPSLAAAALADLTEAEQASLLQTLIKLIRSLQLRQAIPPQRICVTCKYFRPNVHPEPAEPHHCAFVDAPFGNRALRLDCAEHEQAGAPEMARNWNAFMTPRRRQEARP